MEEHENWHYRPAAGGQDLVIQDSDQGQARGAAATRTRARHTSAWPECPTTGWTSSARSTRPKKTTYATVEYVDVAAIGQEALKETAFLTSLRNVDALIHVLRAFEDESIPHVGPIDPLRDIKSVEFDLMISDLTQVEKRLERVEKDLKKGRTSELEREQALLLRSKEALEKEQSLRELEMTTEEKKLIKGFMFLSQKPILYVVNIGESTTLGDDLEAAVSRYKLDEVAARPNAGATAICGKVEAELAEMDDEEAAEFLASYGLHESGLVRLIRKSYELLGLISFFTAGEDECRAWTDSAGVEGAAGQPERSTPTWSTTSFAPRPSAGMRCWRRVQRLRRAPRERCAWKARNTWCRMAM